MLTGNMAFCYLKGNFFFFNFSILIFNTANISRYNPFKQKVLGIFSNWRKYQELLWTRMRQANTTIASIPALLWESLLPGEWPQGGCLGIPSFAIAFDMLKSLKISCNMSKSCSLLPTFCGGGTTQWTDKGVLLCSAHLNHIIFQFSASLPVK